MESRNIVVKGARVHNLRNVDLELPERELVCFTGVSGSGKSSMAFDTIYAEGQRRYVESLSAYARQFLGQLEKPDVDSISGLSPTVSIEQKTAGRNPRSTVGTMTEIYDYLRVLFARVGEPHCVACGTAIGSQTRDGIVDRILRMDPGNRFSILAPIVQGRKGEYLDLFEDLQRQGYIRARVDGKVVLLTEAPRLERHIRHDIEVVIDRLTVKPESRARIGEAVDSALRLSEGTLIVSPEAGDNILISASFSCPSCGLGATPPTPQLFSFNSPQGMCPTCRGIGTHVRMDERVAIPDTEKSILEGAIGPLGIPKNRWKMHYYEGVLRRHKCDLDSPWKKIPAQGRRELLRGVKGKIELAWKRRNGSVYRHRGRFDGILPPLEQRYAESGSSSVRRKLGSCMLEGPCTDCEGARLRNEARSVLVDGRSLPEVARMTIEDAHAFFAGIELSETNQVIAEDALKEIRGRLTFLLDVGLNYLSLDRTAPTLSGGESQRIRLASQIGSGLVGVTYVLDEPSIGLHHRDNARLLDALCRLRDAGNRVIVVEHDEDTMRRADRVIDFGPGAGHLGGELVADGTWKKISRTKKSITGAYLGGRLKIAVPEHRRKVSEWLTVYGAKHNNLKNVTAKIPLGVLSCVTGVSGSGKSSLITDILYQALARDLNRAETHPGNHRRITGVDLLDKVIEIDQQPIGRTPRSNPATYTGAFSPIRTLFSQLPESKVRGYKPGRFSFNVRGGRCEACQGNGANLVEMDFLADVWVTCPACEGRRFRRETLDVTFKGESIADVLEMEVEEAANLFKDVHPIYRVLKVLVDVGMGYVKLGQPAPTLSGGEAQRIKLAKELCRANTGQTLYLLDEPTTGLHFADVQNLLNVLDTLVNLGNTVVIIEHNLDVIKTADWVLDLGPEGGTGGGEILAQGTPEEVAAHKGSRTGSALSGILDGDLPVNGTAIPRKRPGKTKWFKAIEVFGARENNLKNVDVTIPRDKMTVISGVSGSGKSSLALDTIFAEGQRRYVESLSAYARQFLGQMPKPKVDRVVGLSPAISIEQKAASKNPRSTVGTITEVYDYLRALYGLLGDIHCPNKGCQGAKAGAQSSQQIVDRILEGPTGRRALILAPLEPDRGEDYDTLIARARRTGYLRGRVDGVVVEFAKPVEIDYRQSHNLDIVIDRVIVRQEGRKRIGDSVEKALDLSGGLVIVADADTGEENRFSQHLSCPCCGRSFDALTPQRLSFNSYEGWCRTCEGMGTQRGMGRNTLIPDATKSLLDGAVLPWGNLEGPLLRVMSAVSREAGFDLRTPVIDLSAEAMDVILYGFGSRWIDGDGATRFQFRGLYPTVESLVRLSPRFSRAMGEFVQDVPCPSCRGTRLADVGSATRLYDTTLPDLSNLPIREVRQWFDNVQLAGRDLEAAGDVLGEISSRLRFLDEVGLGYIALSRRAPTLSGGEAQRIRLASQIGSGLTGVLYVLDEPTIGLHQRDNRRLLTALEQLRDLGNTLVVVEHDRDTLESADHIVDFGPGAGATGGQLVAAGKPGRLPVGQGSLTAKFLKGSLKIDVPERRAGNGKVIEVCGARHNNLKDIDVSIPLGKLVCVTGVSGSGKSSLINDVLYGALATHVNRVNRTWGEHDKVRGLKNVDKVIRIDQAPIGFSPRSNPCTYVKVFDHIRKFFSQLPDSQVRGFKPGHFSFNSRRGRCDACDGIGHRCIEMHFLPDVWVSCDVCDGKRFNRDILEVKYRGYSIADVLDATIEEAVKIFDSFNQIRRSLQTMYDVGLGYMKMGQASTTLSGGEAQRVKLARELARPSTRRTIYLLDEPTTGLHFADIQKLLDVLNRLVDAGNSVVIIEHNLDVIKTADWVIDLGPEGGDAGGRVVATGSPEDVASVESSHTGKFLKEILAA
ncbi:MAG: excinuclease ABC subunit UvrA [Candidatus Latescibacterota bacterium]|nr:excinuclease ABC subunit UvrA [Candidatus Latescibacterota bacterium]